MLARKIARAKWAKDETISADAVTADLRTQGNTLSFWRCASSDRNAVQEVALALASTADVVDKLDIVYIDENVLTARAVRFQSIDGETPIERLKGCHVDVQGLDIEGLCVMARLVDERVRAEASVRFSKREVAGLLADAVAVGELKLSDLKEKARLEVEAEQGRRAAEEAAKQSRK